MNGNITRMKLNTYSDTDKHFNKNIKFVVNKEVKNDIPEQTQYNNLNDAIIKAYSLYLKNELHSIGVSDSDGNVSSTDALNYFTNNIILENELEELKEEIEIYKEFLKTYKAEETYKEFKKNRSKI